MRVIQTNVIKGYRAHDSVCRYSFRVLKLMHSGVGFRTVISIDITAIQPLVFEENLDEDYVESVALNMIGWTPDGSAACKCVEPSGVIESESGNGVVWESTISVFLTIVFER